MARPHPLLFDLAAGRAPRHEVGDPDQLVSSAFEHRMSGLLWSRVRVGEITLPRAQAHRLAILDLQVQAHHKRLWSTLDVVQRRLTDIGVRTAIVKGVASEARWYDRPGERPSKDIDLLLEPGGARKLALVLKALQPDRSADAALCTLVRNGTLQSLDLRVEGIEVDLHADLLKVEIPTNEPALLWARTHLLRGQSGITVRSLDAETALIHFLIHLNKDRFSKLLGFTDIARILSRADLDWAFIDEFLAGEGLQVVAYSALNAVTTTLRLPPAPVSTPRGWRAAAWTALWPSKERLLGDLGYATRVHRHFWIPWLADGRAGEALRWWLRRRVLPSRRLVDLYYPDTTGPYPYRLTVGRLRRRRRRATIAKKYRGEMPSDHSG